jgi:o-succinylbenzoate synthase
VTVTDVRCHRVSVALHTPFVTALRTATRVETLLVQVIDSDGASGWGEAPQVWQVTGESVAGAEACVQGPLRSVLTGRDPADLVPTSVAVGRAVPGNFGAKAAVDVALHDLAAQRLGVPLAALLGGAATRVPTDVTVSAGEPAELAVAAKARASEGFDVLKLKVGTDARTDVERVRAVRDAVGPAVRLRLDANQGWTPREAVSVIAVLAAAEPDLEFVEQPVAARDLDGLAWVRARSDLPILADESVYGVRDFVELIRRGAADMVNVKLAKCGGLRVARTLLELARECGIGTIVGSMMESQVGVGAAASLVAAYGTTAVSDLDAAWWLERSPVRGGITYDAACVALPASPGLGIAGLADRSPGTADG